jgi:predicted N-acetyltransferase YhbS
MFDILPERAGDDPAIEALLDRSFGPGRFAKTAYRLREGVEAVASLSFIALAEGKLIGSIRFWPVQVGFTPALLLGPLAVEPALVGRGIGLGLMKRGLQSAQEEGHRLVVLVGDEPYYARVGFARVPPGQLFMPGPVDPARLLVRELVAGAFDGVSGEIRRWPG